MVTYLRRVVKYMIYLIVVFGAIFCVMVGFGAIQMGFNDIGFLLTSDKGGVLALVALGLSLIYPFIGYVKREMNVNPTTGRTKILDVAQLCGYKLTYEDDKEMVLEAATPIKKLSLLYEDKVTINKGDIPASISGNRRSVTIMLFRLESLN